MADFLREVGAACPRLRAHLNRESGRDGPSVVALGPLVQALDRASCRDDARLAPFNARIEQEAFSSLTFNCGGRAAWLTLTSKLRRAYECWITGTWPWERFAAWRFEDLPGV